MMLRDAALLSVWNAAGEVMRKKKAHSGSLNRTLVHGAGGRVSLVLWICFYYAE